MRLALVNGIRTEAARGSKGICPSCGSELIAKCGERKINHWAHKGNRNCDPWWEPETEWHRLWKNNYSLEWQEVSIIDESTGEKHIADILTVHNLVIEFQHSHIDPNERAIREKFYKSMVWIVDGTRLKRDYPRFLKRKKEFRITEIESVFQVDYPEEVFPENWLQSSVPVIFDYNGLDSIAYDNTRNYLYCLFPIRVGQYAILAEITRKAFVNASINGNWSLRIQKFMENLIRKNQEQQEQITLQRQQETRLSIGSYGRRRGPLIDDIEKRYFSDHYKSQRKGRR